MTTPSLWQCHPTRVGSHSMRVGCHPQPTTEPTPTHRRLSCRQFVKSPDGLYGYASTVSGQLDLVRSLVAGDFVSPSPLDDHNELPDLGEVSDHLSLSSNQRRARRIAVCTMGLTGLFMLGMVHLMHRSLREMREDHRAKEESETEAAEEVIHLAKLS